MSGQAAGASLLADALASLLGPAGSLSDPETVAAYTTDWTGRFGGQAVAVARPRTASAVAAVLALAARHEVAVVPQGGNTGLVGGAVPRPLPDGRPQLVLSLRGLADIDLDRPGRLLSAGAGTTLAAAQRVAAKAGLGLGIDLASRESATLGGMVATNAGGLNVCRYGPMRSRVAGLEAVLADGSQVSQMSGLSKESVGWDPAALLVGSEGTLGVVTRVLCRLVPLPAERLVALLAFPELTAAVELASSAAEELAGLAAAELMLPDGIELVARHFQLPAPPGAGGNAACWLTLEVVGNDDPTEQLAGVLESAPLTASALASDGPSRERLWAYRELHTEAVAREGVPHKIDVAVAPSRLPAFLAALPERLAAGAPGARHYVWGHVLEGNMHVNVVGPAPEDERADDAVLELVLELGGAISSEHGIGVAKNRWLTRALSPGNLALTSSVRQALDPGRLLNPGVLEPL